jgi:hypothetical protein
MLRVEKLKKKRRHVGFLFYFPGGCPAPNARLPHEPHEVGDRGVPSPLVVGEPGEVGAERFFALLPH